MEKKKTINIIIYIITGLIIILMVMGAYKAEKKHQDKLRLVVNEKIKEAAKECYFKKECEAKITLKDLYDKGYLEKLFDPVTKENMDENICLEYLNDKVKFCK